MVSASLSAERFHLLCLHQPLRVRFHVGKEQSLLVSGCSPHQPSPAPLSPRQPGDTGWGGPGSRGGVRFDRADRATCFFSLPCCFVSILGSVNEGPSAEYLGFGAVQGSTEAWFCQVLAEGWGEISCFPRFSCVLSGGAQTCSARRSWLPKKEVG